MAIKKTVKKIKDVLGASDRADRWKMQLDYEKQNNPSVFDTRGGDAQYDTIPDDFK